jgi:ribosomal-protein-alanine N-acetyltransferase
VIERKTPLALDPDDLLVHIGAMRKRHIRSVLRIEQQVYPRPWSAALFQSELALRDTRAYFVARVGHTLVGYSGLMMTLDDGHVTTIAVDPAWHRSRIGTRLLLALAREALARDATALTLEVRLSNSGAQELYRRFGFEPVGVRRGYYQDTGEDALIMWARRIQEPAYGELLASHERQLPGRTVFETRRVISSTDDGPIE